MALDLSELRVGPQRLVEVEPGEPAALGRSPFELGSSRVEKANGTG
jgi:hypothetical protein